MQSTLYLNCGTGEIFTQPGFSSNHWPGGLYCEIVLTTTGVELVGRSAPASECGSADLVICGRAFPGDKTVESCPIPETDLLAVTKGSHCDCPNTADPIIASIKKIVLYPMSIWRSARRRHDKGASRSQDWSPLAGDPCCRGATLGLGGHERRVR